MKKNKLYSFSGNVTRFGKVIERDYKANTWAVSERKALSNILYRYKDENNFVGDAYIKLDGKIVEGA